MMRLRRASVIVAMSLLAWAAAAYAECAWVLWGDLPIERGGHKSRLQANGSARRRSKRVGHT